MPTCFACKTRTCSTAIRVKTFWFEMCARCAGHVVRTRADVFELRAVAARAAYDDALSRHVAPAAALELARRVQGMIQTAAVDSAIACGLLSDV